MPTGPSPGDRHRFFDVEPFRSRTARWVARRRADRPLVALGSRQPLSTVRPHTLDAVHRRSGGGAVLVLPDDPIWVDLWIPRDDPLWSDDVLEASHWVGESWAGALASLGLADLAVHRGRVERSAAAALVCFAGLGPGEVTAGGRKLVGLAQWRGRPGALFQTACYRHWDPEPLVDVLDLADTELAETEGARLQLLDDLGKAAVGLDQVGAAGLHPTGTVLAALAAALPGAGWPVEQLLAG